MSSNRWLLMQHRMQAHQVATIIAGLPKVAQTAAEALVQLLILIELHVLPVRHSCGY